MNSNVSCILLVDDNEDDLALTKIRLTKTGGFEQIVTRDEGTAALEFYRNLSATDVAPKVILLDISMPLMSGFEFLDELVVLAPAPRPAVFMLSASESQVDRERASKHAWVEDYLIKPLNKEQAKALAERYGSSGEPPTSRGTENSETK
ncbi:MAG: response regulator [Myxococcota bacterium]